MSSDQFRGTYSIIVPLDHLRDKIRETTRNLINESDLYCDAKINKGNSFEEDPHITILMGLKEQHIANLKAVAQGLDTRFIHYGIFDYFQTSKVFEDDIRREYDVLYQTISSDDLVDFQTLLSLSTGVRWHHIDYKIHITYAYLKYGRAQKYVDRLNDLPITQISELINSVVFKKFQDKSYTPQVVEFMRNRSK